MSVRPHKNLVAWKEAIQFVKDVYLLCDRLPESEKFGLTSQLKRVCVSVPTNIAEGAARSSDREFAYFLHIANGSLSEVDTLLTIAIELNFLKSEELILVLERIDKVGALLNGLIKSLNNKKI
jgi:four helix bundle protein